MSFAGTHVEFAPLNDERWLGFANRAHPTLFQTPRWCNVIAEEYSFPASVALALAGSEVVSGLPYAEVDDFRGRRRVAFAFSDVCEPLGDPDAWPAVEAALCADGMPWQIRSRIAPTKAYDFSQTSGVHQVIELPATMDEASAKFHRDARMNARYMERAGGVCRCIVDESFVQPFHTLFAMLRKHKFRLLPQSRAFFERIVKAYFPENGFGLFAELDGRVVAAALLLSEGDSLYVKYSASDFDARKLRPASYLFREIIRESIMRGFRRLDLGISVEEGLQLFKRHLGATSTPYHEVRYNQQPKSRSTVQLESALSTMTSVLTDPDVPLSAAVAGGEVLYRFFV